jgi:SH3-like domain-containing protein
MFRIIALFVFLLGCYPAFSADQNTAKAYQIIESVGRKYAPDKRTAIFDVDIYNSDSQIILRGMTNLLHAKQLTLDSLSFYKISFIDSILVLPDQTVGDQKWGIVTLSVANIRTSADHAAELASQALMGTPVKVLEITDGWRHIQTPDDYIGWVDENGIVLKTNDQIALWKKSNRYFYNRLMGNLMDAPKRNASSLSDLVMGDLFEAVSAKKNYYKIQFPDGRTGFVKKKDCLSYEQWVSQKPDVKEVLSIARQLLGTAYLWGGTSCKAMDCSGMIKTAWYTQAVIMARDASQQIRYGEKIDFNNITNLQPGDLLFFGRNAQRITHVGMYLGNGLYIHASGLDVSTALIPKILPIMSPKRKTW